MTPPSVPPQALTVLTRALQWPRRHAGQLAVVGASTAMAALVGFGLATSLIPLFKGQLPWVGAAVAAVVTLLVLPAALWARVPQQAYLRLLRRPAVDAPAAVPAAVVPLKPAEARPLAASGTANHAAMHSALAMPAANPLASASTGHALESAGLGEGQRQIRDALTGAYTQQHFVAAADREWARIRRHGEDAALLMIDIDRLKGINERFGAGCGDALLVEITRQVSTTLRQYDLLARFGGGVLVVYLPHTDPIGALDVAERIRERVSALRVTWESHTVRSTVSVGVAGIGASHAALDEVIAEAGTALRDAKAAGRNCVRAAPIPPRRSLMPGFPATGAQRPAGPL